MAYDFIMSSNNNSNCNQVLTHLLLLLLQCQEAFGQLSLALHLALRALPLSHSSFLLFALPKVKVICCCCRGSWFMDLAGVRGRQHAEMCNLQFAREPKRGRPRASDRERVPRAALSLRDLLVIFTCIFFCTLTGPQSRARHCWLLFLAWRLWGSL